MQPSVSIVAPSVMPPSSSVLAQVRRLAAAALPMS
jgi:hypothetical protein